MSFQIYSIDNPEYLKDILPLFQNDSSCTSKELSNSVTSIGLSIHPRRSRHLLQIWYVLGILNRSRVKGGAFRYQISIFGEELLTKLNFNEPIAIDLGHWAWYSAWHRSPNFERAWSWLYQDICNLLWERSPQRVVTKQLTADAIERASGLYEDQIPALDTGSTGSVMAWLAAMKPAFLSRKNNETLKETLQSQRRDSCSPELFYLAIQLQYYIKNLSFGTPLLADDGLITDVCKASLLNSDAFWSMFEICALTFQSITRKETAYGSSLNVMKAAPFTPPEPRSTKTITD